jgi:cell division protein FtsA
MAFIGGGNRSKRLRGAPLAALDVGTSKICCLISRVDADNRIRLRGVGQHISRGLRAGTVVDIEAAQLAIAQAVASAEEMAGETIRQVYVNVSGGRPASEIRRRRPAARRPGFRRRELAGDPPEGAG